MYCLTLLLIAALGVEAYESDVVLSSNFELDRTSVNSRISEPISFSLGAAGRKEPGCLASDGLPLQKYQLFDTEYSPEDQTITRTEQILVFSMEPPQTVFEPFRISINNYRLLESREFKIVIVNPAAKFRLTVNEIYSDSDYIKRIEKRKLPLSLNASTKYPFNFQLYVTERRPQVLRLTVYFVVGIYNNNNKLIDEKIWPCLVTVKVIHNQLKLVPVLARNCFKQPISFQVRNQESINLQVTLSCRRRSDGVGSEYLTEAVTLGPDEMHKYTIDCKDNKFVAYTKMENKLVPDSTYPNLQVPIVCLRDLVIDHTFLGIVTDDRWVLEVPLTVSSYTSQLIHLVHIDVKSTSKTVKIKSKDPEVTKVPPNSKQLDVAMLYIYSSRSPDESGAFINITIKYMMRNADDKGFSDLLVASTKLSYTQIRSPVSVGNKRFIDVTKTAPSKGDPHADNRFLIRNNLNFPIALVNVHYDTKIFRVAFLQAEKAYIYPNQQRQELSLTYIGNKELKVSPIKQLLSLEFNGNIFVPIEMVIYDHTLQCVFSHAIHRCASMPPLDFGYFTNLNLIKEKQIVLRNWNPENKNLQIVTPSQLLSTSGFNISVAVIGPFPSYDMAIKRQNTSTTSFYLKGQHLIILSINVEPLRNATSTQFPLIVLSENERIQMNIKLSVEDGTIALIPQLIRFRNVYSKKSEFVNLVSTYKTPYKIRHFSSNNSAITINYNGSVEITEKQWISADVIYNPFAGVGNVTSICCDENFLFETTFEPLLSGTNPKLQWVLIKMETSTDLEATAMVLIERNPKPLIIGFSEKDPNKNLEFILSKADGFLQQDIAILNQHPETVKYTPHLYPARFIEDIDIYLIEAFKKIQLNVSVLLCVSEQLKQLHNLHVLYLKSMFKASVVPSELMIEILGDTFVVNVVGTENVFSVAGPELAEWPPKQVIEQYSVCYDMVVNDHFAHMIDLGIIVDLLEQQTLQTVQQFLEKENSQVYGRQLAIRYDPFYDKIKVNLSFYCDLVDRPFFAFCKSLPVTLSVLHPGQSVPNKISQTQGLIVQPGNFQSLRLNIINPDRMMYEFQLILANNYSTYEIYNIRLFVYEPEVQILLPGDLIKVGSPPSKAEKVLSQKYKTLGKALLFHLPNNHTVENQIVSVRQHFYLLNTGNMPVVITHFGFNHIESTCIFKHFKIAESLCLQNQSTNTNFTLQPEQIKPIVIEAIWNVSEVMHNAQSHFSQNATLYLYSDEGYHISLKLIAESEQIIEFSPKGSKYLRVLVSFLLHFAIIVLALLFLFVGMFSEKVGLQFASNKNLFRAQYERWHYKRVSCSSSLASFVKPMISSPRKQLSVQSVTLFSEEQIRQLRIIAEQRSRRSVAESYNSQIARPQEDLSESRASEIFIEEQAPASLSNEPNESVQGGQTSLSSDQAANSDDKEESRSQNGSERSSNSDQSLGGVTITMSQADLDEDFGGFGFEDLNMPKQTSFSNLQEVGYYNVFFSQNPLKKEGMDGIEMVVNSKRKKN